MQIWTCYIKAFKIQTDTTKIIYHAILQVVNGKMTSNHHYCETAIQLIEPDYTKTDSNSETCYSYQLNFLQVEQWL